MAIEMKTTGAGGIFEVLLTGKLVKEDYETFVPAVDEAIKAHGKMRMLVVMHDFHGWTASAAWEDTKFGARHFRDIERLAMVGETKWQHGMAIFCKPFTTATVRYFEHDQVEAARAWLNEA
jgi:SpoIIAA-like